MFNQAVLHKRIATEFETNRRFVDFVNDIAQSYQASAFFHTGLGCIVFSFREGETVIWYPTIDAVTWIPMTKAERSKMGQWLKQEIEQRDNHKDKTDTKTLVGKYSNYAP